MDEQRIETIEDIAAFLSGAIDTPLVLHGSKDEVYLWVEKVSGKEIWLLFL